MSGGGEDGSQLEPSIIETPTFVLAVVFFVFLALSFCFELGVHHLKQFFLRRGKHGMADAVDKIVMELTLLGFVSLLLTALSGQLGKICVSYSPTLADWTLESNIRGCPCCLANTHGITLCSQMDHGCLYNITSHQSFCDCSVTGSEDYADSGPPYTESKLVSGDCKPYDVAEAQLYIDMALSSVGAIADNQNITVSDLCAELVNGSEFVASYVEGLRDSELEWGGMAQRQRRRQLLESGGGNKGEVIRNPLKVLLEQNLSANTNLHLLPRLKMFKCTGPFVSSHCPDGQVPLISDNALHQMHIWLFLVAVSHVVVSVIQILLGRLRLRLWHRWERQARAAELEAASPPPAPLDMPTQSSQDLVTASKLPCSPGDLPLNPHQGSAAAAAVAARASDEQPCAAAADVESAAGGGADAAAGPAAVAAGNATHRVGAKMRQWATRGMQRWRQPRPAMSTPRHLLSEIGICFLQALSPNTVTRSNFLAMRQAWLSSALLAPPGHPQPPAAAAGATAAAATPEDEYVGKGGGADKLDGSATGGQGLGLGRLASSGGDKSSSSGSSRRSGGGRRDDGVQASGERSPSAQVLLDQQPNEFVTHLLDCLEDDLPAFVGLSIEMGVVACALLLLSGVMGWIGPLFLVFAAVLLLGTNMFLVALLRRSCLGGQPHGTGSQRSQWWRNPHVLLAIPLRMILFLCAFVYSSLSFFAWQFGPHSCFFTNETETWNMWGLPWFSGFVTAALMLLWVGIVTIPTFSLVVHPLQRSRSRVALSPHSGGSAHHRSDEQHHSGHSGHSGHAHGISMLVEVAKASWQGEAPGRAASHQHSGSSALALSQAAPVVTSSGAALAAATAGSGSVNGSGGLEGLDAGGQEAQLIAEVARLRARVAELERDAGQLGGASHGASGGGAPGPVGQAALGGGGPAALG